MTFYGLCGNVTDVAEQDRKTLNGSGHAASVGVLWRNAEFYAKKELGISIHENNFTVVFDPDGHLVDIVLGTSVSVPRTVAVDQRVVAACIRRLDRPGGLEPPEPYVSATHGK